MSDHLRLFERMMAFSVEIASVGSPAFEPRV
jgi:hypothetical protein